MDTRTIEELKKLLALAEQQGLTSAADWLKARLFERGVKPPSLSRLDG